MLTPYQRRVISVALTLVAFVLIGWTLNLAFTLLQRFVVTFASLLWPLASAGILAMILQPVVSGLERRCRLPRTGAILLLYGVLVVVLGLAAMTVLPVLVGQAVDFVQDAPRYGAAIRVWLEQQHPALFARLESRFDADMRTRLTTLFTERWREIPALLLPAVTTAGQWAGKLGTSLIGLVMIPVYLFFLLRITRDLGQDLRRQLGFLKAEWRDDAVFLVREFVGSVVAFFRGQLVIAAIMGIMLAIGFSIVGVNFALFLGLTIGLLNVVPYLGSLIGLCSVLPVAYFQPDGGLSTMLYALLVFVIVQALEGNVLTPMIMGRSTGLHPMVVILALFFWGTALGGVLGMILAIPLTAFLVVAWRLFMYKYAKA